MMTSSNGNIFRVTGPLWGKPPSPADSPHKGQWRGALMFLWSSLEQSIEHAVETRVILDAIPLIMTSLLWVLVILCQGIAYTFRRTRYYLKIEYAFYYDDVIMSVMASQTTSLAIDYSVVYSGTGERKHLNSASPPFVRGIHRLPVNSPHRRRVTRKCFHLMTSSCNTRLMKLENTVAAPSENKPPINIQAWHGFSYKNEYI